MGMEFKYQLKFLREKAGLTQQELAKKIDCNPRTVSSWEQGVRTPNSTQRGKLSKIFNVSESELFRGPSSEDTLTPEVLEALKDPIAIKALLVTHKNSQDIKNAIKAFLECLPDLTPEKRQAILALCK